MIIAGAGGHAEEVFSVWSRIDRQEEVFFFDNVNARNTLFSKAILSTEKEVKEIFRNHPGFILGTGSSKNRHALSNLLKQWGGSLFTLISRSAVVGDINVKLGEGLNIMEGVIIYNNVSIGEGTLINTATSVHHGVEIGEYAEISPGSRVLGNVKIGNHAFIGANATLLPGVTIGDYATVGAGAVITSDVPENSLAVGVPGFVKKE
ncbi:acetyltransferase [Fulvivirga sp. M361]|uniref:acetyltransferase n=1 Tax=Fulvivirga sp. M361 TaxID=2594266 RepID=UPI00117A5F3C|nr:acetyltransferase [Fulvivirga sp. M361]TRX50215.1 acetyltransferase [Fulvivirga sp. M361]